MDKRLKTKCTKADHNVDSCSLAFCFSFILITSRPSFIVFTCTVETSCFHTLWARMCSGWCFCGSVGRISDPAVTLLIHSCQPHIWWNERGVMEQQRTLESWWLTLEEVCFLLVWVYKLVSLLLCGGFLPVCERWLVLKKRSETRILMFTVKLMKLLSSNGLCCSCWRCLNRINTLSINL